MGIIKDIYNKFIKKEFEPPVVEEIRPTVYMDGTPVSRIQEIPPLTAEQMDDIGIIHQELSGEFSAVFDDDIANAVQAIVDKEMIVAEKNLIRNLYLTMPNNWLHRHGLPMRRGVCNTWEYRARELNKLVGNIYDNEEE